ncbi:DivIVA domain repeat protein [Arthrobacter sp. RIT-PI-e]|uniref:DivIVA domain-containing protein n=1 Tax=Arthrobacter sp. RIT-PI-e TaxID=1681197 RepID=UPI00067607EC|nr:DivIVA domain-containing protein [Arthrobacter sp. RIT-PI-e]KNC19016.1 DivIVA domain repeat protein [Arthrobacter sp. RIT-PI-e]
MDVARSDTPFPRVGRRVTGYHVRQVDRFITRARRCYNLDDPGGEQLTGAEIRAVAFSRSRGGYDPRSVDAALDRLEDVFARRERERFIEEKGEEAWLRSVGRTAAILRRRLGRPAGERFRRPARVRSRSYDVEDVDRLCDAVLGYLESDAPLSVTMVRHAVFREVRGSEGYGENQVDAFLDRVVDLMAGID